MNFLAHFLLSCPEEETIVGNFLADFLRKAEQDELPDPYQIGIKLHYAIDAYTDQHPRVQHSVRLLRNQHSKYAPVILDVLYDYVLAQNWPVFCDEPLAEFTARMYAILQRHLPVMPERMQRRVPNMIRHEWLLAYTTLPGLRHTFARMTSRVSKPEFFEYILRSFQDHEHELEQDFQAFFPDIQAYAKTFCAGA